MTNRLELSWDLDGFVDEQRYYCSETMIDVNNLPVPKVVLSSSDRAYADTAIELGKTYYVCIGSVKNNIEKVSQVVSVEAVSIATVSLLHFENGFADESGNTWQAFGTNPPRISNVQSRFGSQSLEVNVPQTDTHKAGFETQFADFPLGGDFTIEFWAYVRNTATPLYQAVLDNGYNSTDGLTLVTGNRDGRFSLTISKTSILKESTSLTLNVWQHHAITRSGSVVRKFRDGILTGSGTYAGNVGLPNRKFCLGSYASESGATGQMLNGFIDEFKITKGKALYTANFTPPNAPF